MVPWLPRTRRCSSTSRPRREFWMSAGSRSLSRDTWEWEGEGEGGRAVGAQVGWGDDGKQACKGGGAGAWVLQRRRLQGRQQKQALPGRLSAASRSTLPVLTSGCMAMPVAHTQVPNGTESRPPSLSSTTTSPSCTSVTLRCTGERRETSGMWSGEWRSAAAKKTGQLPACPAVNAHSRALVHSNAATGDNQSWLP